MGKRYNCILIKNMFSKFPFFTVSHRMFGCQIPAHTCCSHVVFMFPRVYGNSGDFAVAVRVRLVHTRSQFPL